jgi:hypothetical protein
MQCFVLLLLLLLFSASTCASQAQQLIHALRLHPPTHPFLQNAPSGDVVDAVKGRDPSKVAGALSKGYTSSVKSVASASSLALTQAKDKAAKAVAAAVASMCSVDPEAASSALAQALATASAQAFAEAKVGSCVCHRVCVCVESGCSTQLCWQLTRHGWLSGPLPHQHIWLVHSNLNTNTARRRPASRAPAAAARAPLRALKQVCLAAAWRVYACVCVVMCSVCLLRSCARHLLLPDCPPMPPMPAHAPAARAVAKAVAPTLVDAVAAATNNCKQAVAAAKAVDTQTAVARALATAQAEACSTGGTATVELTALAKAVRCARAHGAGGACAPACVRRTRATQRVPRVRRVACSQQHQ